MADLLMLPDGRACMAERDPVSGRYVVRGVHPTLGSTVTLHGVRREVAIVADLPDEGCALHLVPDFLDPGCEACGYLFEPPTPEWCRIACGGRRRSHRFRVRRAGPGPGRTDDDSRRRSLPPRNH